MLKLTTPVAASSGTFGISHSNRVLLLGSCFADAMGQRLQQSGFEVMVNPFGTLYNPASIANVLGFDGSVDDIMFQYDDCWHSWLHHSRFSSRQREVCRQRCEESFAALRAFMERCDTVVITLGSAYVYQLADSSSYAVAALSGRVVANCHKVPAAHFCRRRLAVQECLQIMQGEVYESLFGGRRVVATVSPIRHLADGAHPNQLSKSTLLLALDEAVQHYTSKGVAIDYFPAYELLNDELRDYRFYARDLTHPSDLAEDIIYQRFADAYFDDATRQRCRDFERQAAATRHRGLIE